MIPEVWVDASAIIAVLIIVAAVGVAVRDEYHQRRSRAQLAEWLELAERPYPRWKSKTP